MREIIKSHELFLYKSLQAQIQNTRIKSEQETILRQWQRMSKQVLAS